MWRGYELSGKLIRSRARVGNNLGEGLASSLALRAASRPARRGYLAPGSPAPPPTASTDYLDYRGVATWPEMRASLRGEFPLGDFLSLGGRRPRREPIGLPARL